MDNNHEFVDLGLSVMWASCNIGANQPNYMGKRFAWGEISPKDSCTKENSETYGRDIRWLISHGYIDNATHVLNPNHDAASVHWGLPCRMPTKKEILELYSRCLWEWINKPAEHMVGYKITGGTGNSIFLPAEGFQEGDLIKFMLEYGAYWTSTPAEDESNNGAYITSFASSSYTAEKWWYRYYGFAIRPVLPK